MTTELVYTLALFGMLVACRGPGPAPAGPLGAGLEGAPPEVTQSCELAAVRCSRCHPIERLLRAQVDSPSHWRRYVHRMRLMPASGISLEDARRIVRCLVFRSFGRKGLLQLDQGRLDP